MKTKYKIEKLLREEAFSKYYLATTYDDRNKKYIIKQINLNTKTDNEKESILNQEKLIKKLDHPNIIKYKEVFIQRNPKEALSIVKEFTDIEDLAQKIEAQKNEPFPESQILDYFIQICLALQYLHNKKVFSLILKKNYNFFLTKSGIVKLDYCPFLKGLKDTWGKNDFSYKDNDKMNDEEINIMLLGELLYQLLTFKKPFNTKSSSLPNKVDYSPVPEIYSEGIKDILKNCLNLNTKKITSINDILQLPIIKDRINNFLNEVQYDKNLYTIIAKKYKDKNKIKNFEEDKEKQSKETNIKEKKVNDKNKVLKFFKEKAGKKAKMEINQEPIEKMNKTNFLKQKKDPNFQKDKIYKEDEIGKVLNDKGYIDLIDEKSGNFDVNKMSEDQYNQLRLLNNLYRVVNNQEQDSEGE